MITLLSFLSITLLKNTFKISQFSLPDSVIELNVSTSNEFTLRPLSSEARSNFVDADICESEDNVGDIDRELFVRTFADNEGEGGGE